MVARGAEIEDGVEIGSLSGGGEVRADSPFELGYLGGHGIVGGVGEAGVEIPVLLKVEEPGHLLGSGIFESSALIDREHTGFSVAGFPSPLDAHGAYVLFLVHM